MSEWEVINKKIEQNNGIRNDYKAYLGMTLTEYVTILRAKGLTPKEAFKSIIEKLATHGLEGNKVTESVWISVNARYGEQKSAEKRNISVLPKTKDFYEHALESFVQELELKSVNHPEISKDFVANKLRYILNEARKK